VFYSPHVKNNLWTTEYAENRSGSLYFKRPFPKGAGKGGKTARDRGEAQSRRPGADKKRGPPPSIPESLWVELAERGGEKGEPRKVNMDREQPHYSNGVGAHTSIPEKKKELHGREVPKPSEVSVPMPETL